MEAEKSYNLPSAKWRTRKASGGIWSESRGLRTRGTNGVSPSWIPKAWESKGQWCEAQSKSEGLGTRNANVQGRRRWIFQLKQRDLKFWGLPWWRSGWESACQCRGHGFEPWSGEIPHATEQLGPWATTTEPACLEPVLRNKRGRDSERPAHRDEEWTLLATTRESPRTETKTQHSQKINK